MPLSETAAGTDLSQEPEVSLPEFSLCIEELESTLHEVFNEWVSLLANNGIADEKQIALAREIFDKTTGLRNSVIADLREVDNGIRLIQEWIRSGHYLGFNSVGRSKKAPSKKAPEATQKQNDGAEQPANAIVKKIEEMTLEQKLARRAQLRAKQ